MAKVKVRVLLIIRKEILNKYVPSNKGLDFIRKRHKAVIHVTLCWPEHDNNSDYKS